MRQAIAVTLAFVVAVLLTSCTTPGPGPMPEFPPTPSLARPSLVAGTASRSRPAPSAVSIAGAQGLELKGTYTPSGEEAGPAVLLLHMYGSERRSWEPFAEAQAAVGISSLAIDLRGHGETGGPEDWALAPQDVAAAFVWLQSRPGVDPSRVGIVGASIGANLALVQAAAHPDEVAAAVLLSPGLDYFRVKIEGLVEEARGVPLFLAASEDDSYSAETVRILADQAPGNYSLSMFAGASHGTDMLVSHPELADGLIRFLREVFHP